MLGSNLGVEVYRVSGLGQGFTWRSVVLVT